VLLTAIDNVTDCKGSPGKQMRSKTIIITIIIIIRLLIDVAIPSDKNVIQKEAEKKLKYKNLSIEIQRMWNMKCFVIPVIIGATGIVSKSYKDIWKQYQDNTQ
jgi:hypothetical protein